LRSPTSPSKDDEDDYEKSLVEAYDKKLYKEFVLISLARWREGMVAMRWRTEEEVRSGKGETGCAELACDRKREGETEVLFAYVEHEEKKEALVKVRLCKGCGEKLRRAREREKRGSRSRDRRRSRSRSPKRRSEDRERRRRGDDRSRSPNRHSEGKGEDRERKRHRKRDRSGSPKDSDRRSRRGRSRSSHGHHEKLKVL
jgi:protein FRA10AC1